MILAPIPLNIKNYFTVYALKPYDENLTQVEKHVVLAWTIAISILTVGLFPLILVIFQTCCFREPQERRVIQVTFSCLTNAQQRIFTQVVQKYIDNGKLPLEQALHLRADQCYSLHQAGIQKYVDSNELTVDHAIHLDRVQCWTLDSPYIQKYLGNGKLNIEQVLALSDDQKSNLSSQSVQKYLDRGGLTMDQVLNLTWFTCAYKLNPLEIQERIDNGELTVAEALA